jgi:hypothetical protein
MSPRRVFLFRHPTADQRRRERADERRVRHVELYPAVRRDVSFPVPVRDRCGEWPCLLDDERDAA